ncbi:YHS domain-containing protein [Flavobacterium aciduliphilum]|uniref:YHS domain-containing protein n=1 Tax=Flavobacterium aciduliphilum TaxID=1101402 RepID=A0A328Y7M3_9FLAO|nr:YHS domain-containing protein [Flavobacterium aciduliphilum]RAR69273.1 YHS domain-containing protein [Flavobacterium aciduliphilum]
MKNILFILFALFLFASCKKETLVEQPNKSEFKKPINSLNSLKYANKIDFYCQMDIAKYGVSDTAHYKGNLYGFCSKMCKDEFLKSPEKYLAKK